MTHDCLSVAAEDRGTRHADTHHDAAETVHELVVRPDRGPAGRTYVVGVDVDGVQDALLGGCEDAPRWGRLACGDQGNAVVRGGEGVIRVEV